MKIGFTIEREPGYLTPLARDPYHCKFKDCMVCTTSERNRRPCPLSDFKSLPEPTKAVWALTLIWPTRKGWASRTWRWYR